MRLWMDVVFLTLAASWKWLLAVAGAIVLVVSGLFIAGVFSGDSEASASAPAVLLEATAVPVATATPMPTAIPTIVPRATAVPEPRSTILPAPTLVLPLRVEVPVYLSGANNIGSLEFVLVYEPTVLEIANVEPGPLARNALVEFGARTSGRLWAGLIDTNGLHGDGPVAIVTFNVIGQQSSSSALRLENVLAYNASSLLDVLTEASAGNFVVEGQVVTAPALTFTP